MPTSESQKRWVKNNPEKIRQYSLRYKETRPLSFRFNKYAQSAKKRGYIFIISKEEFESIINQPCFYCKKIKSDGIDRKDNSIGYEIKNCLPCCYECNMMKGKLNFNDFLNKCELIAKNKQT